MVKKLIVLAAFVLAVNNHLHAEQTVEIPPSFATQEYLAAQDRKATYSPLLEKLKSNVSYAGHKVVGAKKILCKFVSDHRREISGTLGLAAIGVSFFKLRTPNVDALRREHVRLNQELHELYIQRGNAFIQFGNDSQLYKDLEVRINNLCPQVKIAWNKFDEAGKK